MKLFVLLAFTLATFTTAHAGEKGGKFSINGFLKESDSGQIPAGPGYDFRIDAEYRLVSKTKSETGIMRTYFLKAKLPSGMPFLSYLGKSLLLLSNRLDLLCREVKGRGPSFTEINTLKHTVGENLEQHVEFNFSCNG